MLSAVQELKLIARCVAFDDRDAFGLLVDAHQDKLRNFLFQLTAGDAVLTDDLSQETFLKAWVGLRSFKGIARFSTWLLRIAYNEYVSYKRKALSEAVEIADNYAVEQNANSAMEARMDIKVLLKALNEKERTVITMFYLQDMPIKKIVSITGIPAGSVKVYLSRGREKMKEVLEKDDIKL